MILNLIVIHTSCTNTTYNNMNIASCYYMLACTNVLLPTLQLGIIHHIHQSESHHFKVMILLHPAASELVLLGNLSICAGCRKRGATKKCTACKVSSKLKNLSTGSICVQPLNNLFSYTFSVVTIVVSIVRGLTGRPTKRSVQR